MELDVEKALARLPRVCGTLDLLLLRRRLGAQAWEWLPWLFPGATASPDGLMLLDVRLAGQAVPILLWLCGARGGWAMDPEEGDFIDPLTLLARATQRDGDRLHKLAIQLACLDPAFALDPLPPTPENPGGGKCSKPTTTATTPA